MDADALAQENARLKARLAEVETALAEAQEARRRLEDILRTSQREKFGTKSEKLTPDQFNLPLEDVELAQGVLDAAQEKAGRAAGHGRGGARQAPAQPRPAAAASAAGRAGDRAREHALPLRLRRDDEDRRGRLRAARRGAGAVAGAGDAPPEVRLPPLLGGGGAGACARACRAGRAADRALIAEIIVSKFGDHLPFYRQAGIFTRQGIQLDRGTLGNWVGRACFHLKPVIEHMRAHLRGADRLFMDETRAPVLDPGRKADEERLLLGDRRRRSRPWRRRPARRAVPLRPGPRRRIRRSSSPDTAAGSCNATPITPTMR